MTTASLKLPDGTWPVIYADPPWHYDNYHGARVKKRTADSYYSTMSLGDIENISVPSRLAWGDAVLFLWATPPCLREALEVMRYWGFEYKTVAFTWVKTTKEWPHKPALGMGFYTRANAEFVLLGTCGHPPRPLRRDVSQVVFAERREHSRKPDEVRERIERLYAGPYLEMFARHPTPRAGWTFWGDEVDNA